MIDANSLSTEEPLRVEGVDSICDYKAPRYVFGVELIEASAKATAIRARFREQRLGQRVIQG